MHSRFTIYRCSWLTGLMLFLGSLFVGSAVAAPSQPHAGALLHSLQRWTGTGRVLYVAAHPDDENTRLLAYLVGARHMDAAYLSLTRGGGGQNLIGREQDTLLGAIRTQELLQARRIDGARQFFSRARDFGFSQTTQETLNIWGKRTILADVVWVLRKFQPHVVITRFPEQGNTHGHHLASAYLARLAVEAAHDPKQFPEQLKTVRPWRVLRLVHNGSTWWLRGKSAAEKKKYLSQFLRMDVGQYNPLLGQSYGEIAARSRSMHKSQGFGAALQRGPEYEYFKHVSGVPAKHDILEGVPTDWQQVPGAATMAPKLKQHTDHVITSFQPNAPEKSLPGLIRVWKLLSRIPTTPWLVQKRRELQELMVACAGLYLDARTAHSSVVPGQTVPISVQALNRSRAPIALEFIQINNGFKQRIHRSLPFHVLHKQRVQWSADPQASLSVPSWLSRPGSLGTYAIPNPLHAERADDPAPIQMQFGIQIGDIHFILHRPVRYVWIDRVQGELAKFVQILPPLTVTPISPMLMFPNHQAQTLRLDVRSGQDKISGVLRIRVARGWKVVPESIPLSFRKHGELQRHSFLLTPSTRSDRAVFAIPEIQVGTRTYSWKEHNLRYSHIPQQTVLEPAGIRLVPVQLQKFVGKVGYIPGSGDYVVEALRQVGVDVHILEPEAVMTGQFQHYRTIVTGIRAYNQNRALRQMQKRLLSWVKQGGTLVVQYNTSSWWQPFRFPIGPYPLSLGRERVTDETAPIVAIQPTHPVLQYPHRIETPDFLGWVQERGLYFAATWDSRYQPILRMADSGKKASLGSVLTTTYGKGAFVYTGLSFFRQLPAGVPGAYRLFLNLLAYSPRPSKIMERQQKPTSRKTDRNISPSSVSHP